MTRARLHAEQIELSHSSVREMVDSQFPRWADLPLNALDSTGTINRVDLLGEDMVVRIPFIVLGKGDVERDREVLPLLEGVLPVEVPRLVGHGAPTAQVPWEWGVYSRLAGRHPVLGEPADEDAVAEGLVHTVRALRALTARAMSTTAELEKRSQARGTAAEHDTEVRPKVKALGSAALPTTWDEAVEAATYAYTPAFTHGDLMPNNLFLTDAPAGPHLTGVLDWATAGIGDPALDLLPAWSCLTSRTRTEFLASLGATDHEVARARGYAAQKVGWGLEYYRHSSPAIFAVLAFMLEQLES